MKIELVIIILYFICMLIIGKIINNKVKTSSDYLVGGRSMPTWLITGTLFATFWGGGTMLGCTGVAFHEGVLGTIADPFAAGLALILLGLFFVSAIRKLNVNSIGEIYMLRYNRLVSYLASILMVPTYILWTAVQIIAIGKVISILLEVNYSFAIIVSAIVVITYTYLGGILAVVWTDTIQLIIIFIGLLILVPKSISYVGGLDVIKASTPEGFWSFIPKDKSLVSWLSYIAAWCGMALGNIPSPDIAQRAFCSKDEKVAKKSAIISGLMYWVIGLVPIFMGLVAITMVQKGFIDPQIFSDDSELIIPYMAKILLGPVALGIFAGSLAAAVMSSASSAIFASAVILSNDLVKPLLAKKHIAMTDKMILISTKVSVLIIGLLSLVVSFYATSLYDLMIFGFALLFSSLFFPFLLAFHWKKANAYGALAGMIAGFSINLAGCIIQGTFVPGPDWFFTLVPAVVNLILIVTVSLATQNICKPKALKAISSSVISVDVI